MVCTEFILHKHYMLTQTHISHVSDNEYTINNILFQQKKNQSLYVTIKQIIFRDTEIL